MTQLEDEVEEAAETEVRTEGDIESGAQGQLLGPPGEEVEVVVEGGNGE